MIHPVDRLPDQVSVVGDDGDVHLLADFEDLDHALHAIPEHPVLPMPGRELPTDAAKRVVGQVVEVHAKEDESPDAHIPADEMAAAIAYEEALEEWNEKVWERMEKRSGGGGDRLVVENELASSRPHGESVDELRARYAKTLTPY